MKLSKGVLLKLRRSSRHSTKSLNADVSHRHGKTRDNPVDSHGLKHIEDGSPDGILLCKAILGALCQVSEELGGLNVRLEDEGV